MKKVMLIGVAALLGLLALAPLPAQSSWTFADFEKAQQQSGRALGSFNEKAFADVQQRKQAYLEAIQSMLARNFGSADAGVMKAFRELPREYFMYDYEKNRNLAELAYEPLPPKEWAIGYGSTLSDYIIQAYMTQMLEPKPTDISLEIGTGSGFQSALLSRIVKTAYTIEIISALGEKVRNIFAPLGYDNVRTRVGDGFYGWPEVKEGFDIIIVTAQAPFVPSPLLDQLKRNGRMVIPIGQAWKPQYLYYFYKDQDGKVHSRRDVSVLFIPMTGEIQKAAPQP
jgi:protein-L-isoaspartate(D-aspartate) O-methyltransferase